ncbi:hypothetical protein B0H17DRAFT_1145491 [Mycena rosella]|uniref:Uncharacterized protein n=1 Tax=Mycena rosella TaxID=1033263 RepID=A0AAD7CTC0_MYCRO|nr:hypothetical protein B0H17DRAFT_1145491 [Mycena rosella]
MAMIMEDYGRQEPEVEEERYTEVEAELLAHESEEVEREAEAELCQADVDERNTEAELGFASRATGSESVTRETSIQTDTSCTEAEPIEVEEKRFGPTVRSSFCHDHDDDHTLSLLVSQPPLNHLKLYHAQLGPDSSSAAPRLGLGCRGSSPLAPGTIFRLACYRAPSPPQACHRDSAALPTMMAAGFTPAPNSEQTLWRPSQPHRMCPRHYSLKRAVVGGAKLDGSDGSTRGPNSEQTLERPSETPWIQLHDGEWFKEQD